MGTETNFHLDIVYRFYGRIVKLNNPLMGTETKELQKKERKNKN